MIFFSSAPTAALKLTRWYFKQTSQKCPRYAMKPTSVDWVFTTLQTPWSSRYIPETAYQHVDINCNIIIPQQANNNKYKYTLHHAEVPDDDSLVIPHERMYVKLSSTSFSSIQIWIRHEPSISDIIPTLPYEKTRVTLHFRKKPSQTITSQTV